MAASAEPRVALYFDFDNIVISRYDQLHGDGAYRKDTSRSKAPTASAQTVSRLADATVDIDAVLDFAATFGTIALARAYADWSNPINASYRGQLIDRAVDLVQLFPLVKSMKNGADIRLAVDAVEDLFRLDGLTHIVIVAGDSDYVPLAQKAKRLGAYVIGIGVAGGTSRALSAACDEFADYDALLVTDATVDEDEAAAPVVAVAAPVVAPAVAPAVAPEVEVAPVKASRSRGRRATSTDVPDGSVADASAATEPPSTGSGNGSADASAAAAGADVPEAAPAGLAVAFQSPTADAATPPSRNPGRLLLKALELLRAKNDEEWQPTGAVKNQMLRMDPSFQERRLGFGSFTDFAKSRGGVVELDEVGNRLRVRPKKG